MQFGFFVLFLLLAFSATTDSTDLLVGYIGPLEGSQEMTKLDSGYASAFCYELAISVLNNEINTSLPSSYAHLSTLFPSFRILRDARSSYQDKRVALTDTLELINNGSVAIIGAFNTLISEVVSLVAGSFQIPQMSYGSTAGIFSDKSLHPTFSRTVPSAVRQAEALARLYSQFGWKRVATVSTTDAYATSSNLAFCTKAKELGMTVLADLTLDFHDSDEAVAQIATIIRDSGARIIFMSLDVYDTRRVCVDGLFDTHIQLIMAFNDVGIVKDGYVLGGAHGLMSPALILFENGTVDAQLAEGSIGAVPAVDITGELYQWLDTEMMTYSVNPRYPEFDPSRGANYSIWCPYAFDATLTVGMALKSLLDKGLSPVDNRTAFYNEIIAMSWNGTTGNVTMDENGDRIGGFSILNFRAGGVLAAVGSVSADGSLDLGSQVVWHGGGTDVPADHSLTDDGDDEPINLAIYLLAVVMVILISRRRMIFMIKDSEERSFRKQWTLDYQHLTLAEEIGRGAHSTVYRGVYKNQAVSVKVVHDSFSPPNISTASEGGPGNAMSGVDASGTSSSASASVTNTSSVSLGAANLMVSNSNVVASNTRSTVASNLTADELSRVDSVRSRRQHKIERVLSECKVMARVRHPNVILFIGCVDVPNAGPAIVTDYMPNGSLLSIISNPSIDLTWSLRVSFALDAARGIRALHALEPPVIHRDLKSANLLCDLHNTIKVTDFNVSAPPGNTSSIVGSPPWMAPEVVTEKQYSKASDVYALGVIIWELLTRERPFSGLNTTEIFESVRKNGRPRSKKEDKLRSDPTTPQEFVSLMEECWAPNPSRRPGIDEIVARLARLKTEIDRRECVIRMPVAQSLLFKTFPRHIVEAVARGDSVPPEPFDNACLVFCDVVGYHELSAILRSDGARALVDRLYQKLDEIAPTLGLLRIETTGTSFLVAGNIQREHGPHPEADAIEMALRCVEEAISIKLVDDINSDHLRIRVAVHYGNVVASVVGTNPPRYSLFGDAVNTAYSVQKAVEPMHVIVTQAMYDALGADRDKLLFESRFDLNLKSRGTVRAWHVYRSNESPMVLLPGAV